MEILFYALSWMAGFYLLYSLISYLLQSRYRNPKPQDDNNDGGILKDYDGPELPLPPGVYLQTEPVRSKDRNIVV